VKRILNFIKMHGTTIKTTADVRILPKHNIPYWT
jgi:hypothetical protein